MSERLPKVRDGNLIVANIPMCDDQGCPSRTNCFRHSAGGRVPRAEKQPYFAEPTRGKDEDSCPFMWPIRVNKVRYPRVRRVTVVSQYTIRNDPAQLRAFLTVKEVAKICGDVSPHTIESWSRRTDLHFPKPLKIGSRTRVWLRSDIEAYLKSEEIRGTGARGRHAWVGGTAENPAHPWVHPEASPDTVHDEPNTEDT